MPNKLSIFRNMGINVVVFLDLDGGIVVTVDGRVVVAACWSMRA